MRCMSSLLALTVLAVTPGICGTAPDGSRELVAWHSYWEQTRPRLRAASAVADTDVDDVALLEDHDDLVVRKNPFDLDGAALRFAPNPRGGYDVARLALPLDAPGTRLGLGSDDAQAVDLPFAFPFFGIS